MRNLSLVMSLYFGLTKNRNTEHELTKNMGYDYRLYPRTNCFLPACNSNLSARCSTTWLLDIFAFKSSELNFYRIFIEKNIVFENQGPKVIKSQRFVRQKCNITTTKSKTMLSKRSYWNKLANPDFNLGLAGLTPEQLKCWVCGVIPRKSTQSGAKRCRCETRQKQTE